MKIQYLCPVTDLRKILGIEVDLLRPCYHNGYIFISRQRFGAYGMISIRGVLTNMFELWSDGKKCDLPYIPSYIKINNQSKTKNTLWFHVLCLFLREIMGLGTGLKKL